MRLVNSGVLHTGVDPARDVFSCFPSLCRLHSGEIIASFQVGPTKNHMYCTAAFSRSNLDELRWSAAETPFRDWATVRGLTVHAAYLSEVEPGRILAALQLCDHLGDPSLPYFNSETGGLLPMRIGLCESTDGGWTWGEPRFLESDLFGDVPMPVHSPVVCMANGEMYLSFETSKPYDQPGVWVHHAAYLVSADGGRTWGETRVAAHDREDLVLYGDPRMVALSGGRCLASFWVIDNVTGMTRTAAMSVSPDGRTWPEVPAGTGIVGQPWPIPMDDDEIVVVMVDRYEEKAVFAVHSSDLGQSFGEKLVVYRHGQAAETPDNVEDWLTEINDWAFGLPSGVRVDDREILIVWYAGSSTETSVYWARLHVPLEA